MDRQALHKFYRLGVAQIESNPDEAIRLLGEGSEAAETLGDAYYKVLCDHWRLQALIVYKHDFKTANKLAIQGALDARHPAYMNYQEYICIQQDLILVYQGIDPVGYADEIKEAIDLMLDSTSPSSQCHRCLKQTLVQYHIDKGERDQAENYATDYFMSTQFDNYHRAFAAAMKCQFAFWNKDYDDMLAFARIGIQVSEHRTWDHYWLELKAWEMLALEYLGQPDKATENYGIITGQVKQIRAVLNHRFYYAVLTYHELRKDHDAAMSHWQSYLAHLDNSGEYHWQCLAYLEHIRLLQQQEQSTDDVEAKFRAIASQMRPQSQARMISKLESLLATG